MKHSFIFLFVGLVLVTGCGKNKRGSDYPALTDTQKAVVRNVNTSTTRTVSAVRTAKLNMRPGSDSTTVDYSMANSLKNANCAMAYSNTFTKGMFDSAAQYPMGNFSMDVSAGGTACPANLNLSFSMRTSSEQIRFGVNASYSVNDVVYASLNDVTGFKLNGELVMRGTKEGKIVAEGTADGDILSKQYGTVALKFMIEGEGDKNSGEFLLTNLLTFNDFVAELKILVTNENGKSKTEYIVNGEEVSGQEFMTYYSGLVK